MLPPTPTGSCSSSDCDFFPRRGSNTPRSWWLPPSTSDHSSSTHQFFQSKFSVMLPGLGKGGVPAWECDRSLNAGEVESRRGEVSEPVTRLLSESECLLNIFISNIDGDMSDVMF